MRPRLVAADGGFFGEVFVKQRNKEPSGMAAVGRKSRAKGTGFYGLGTWPLEENEIAVAWSDLTKFIVMLHFM